MGPASSPERAGAVVGDGARADGDGDGRVDVLAELLPDRAEPERARDLRGEVVAAHAELRAKEQHRGADDLLVRDEFHVAHVVLAASADGRLGHPGGPDVVPAHRGGAAADRAAERAQQVNFTIPYYREGVALLLAAGGKYKSYDEMKAAGSGVTVSVLQNVYAEDMVHAALPEAKVDQYDSVDLIYEAVNSGRADAAATDQSSAKWLIVTTPGKYVDSGYGWNPQSYSCAVKRGDQDWLNFVNTSLHEAMTGVEFGTYSASFKKWFGVELPPPAIGFPVEYQ